jgi:hypothetical protein
MREGDSGEPVPAIIVYGFEDAVAALAAAEDLGRKIRLQCPFAVAASLGPQLAKSMIEQATAAVPEAIATWSLDCDGEPGTALAALHVGVPEVHVSLPAAARARIADIGRQLGARVSEDPRGTPMLDLANADDPISACRQWLASLE